MANLKYVWVVQTYIGCTYPTIERYEMVRKNAGGAYTVKCRGGTKVVKVAAGRKFFEDEQQFWLYVRTWVSNELDRARQRVADYTDVFNRLASGDRSAVTVNEVSSEPITFGSKLKLE